MRPTVTSTGGGPLYRAILKDMNTAGRQLATAADLARVPMLAEVAGESLRQLALAHPVRNFTAGRVLLRQGAPAAHLMIMLAGPCVIDKAAVLAAGAYPATWVATAPGRALVLGAPAFWTLLRQQPPVREHVLRYLARQVGQDRDALAARSDGAAARRISHWLLAVSASGASPAVHLPAGQQGLAEELGLSRVTVNRALQQLARSGTVSIRPRTVIVLDPVRLACTGGSRSR
jgi:CRP/FNR family transcriptional regulator, cyclic AMP receptor protein